MAENKYKEDVFEKDYSRKTLSDEDDDQQPFEDFNERQKDERMRYLWGRAFAKAKGAMIIINRF